MITVQPIARVRNARTAPIDDHWGDIESVIELLDPFTETALAGITAFSHVEIIYVFDRVPEHAIQTGARHPRNNPAWPLVGILAQRGKNRPNRLGVSIARLVAQHGRTLTVLGLDAIDGTPVLDIKPVMREFLPREPVQQPAWATELMRHYWHTTP